MKKLLLLAFCCAIGASSAVADTLVVTSQPTSITSLTGFQVNVAVQDAQGNVDTSYNSDVTLNVGSGSPADETLSNEVELGNIVSGAQTVHVVSGIATFTHLMLDRGGDVNLQATSSNASSTSAAIHVTPGMQFSLEAQDTTAAHNMLSSSVLHTGQDFDLAVYVRDIRVPTSFSPGIAGAWVNVSYDDLASITATAHSSRTPDPGIHFSPSFPLTPSGNLDSPGLIRDAGAAVIASPRTTDKQLLFRVLVHVDHAGTETFSTLFDPQTPDVGHDSFFSHPVLVVTEDQMEFGQLSLTFVPEPSSMALAALGAGGLALCVRRRRRR